MSFIARWTGIAILTMIWWAVLAGVIMALLVNSPWLLPLLLAGWAIKSAIPQR